MGLMEETVEERMKILESLATAAPGAQARRQRLFAAIEATSHEFHALGIEMNHRYESKAIYVDDEIGQPPEWPADPILYHQSSTFPGSRLPHAWLNSRVPRKEYTSTLDLAGHGNFCILTGIGGDEWKSAAGKVGKELGLDIPAYSIGWGQDYEDVYRDWEKKREVGEMGCVLVRPDRYVCWRALHKMDDSENMLRQVLKKILGLC